MQADTITCVSPSSKKIDLKYILHVGEELTRVVEENFDGNQTKAAPKLGISQPHLSNLMKGTTERGPGLVTLIRLRQYTGKSIDDLLGLGPPPAIEALTATMERMRQGLLELTERVKEAAPPYTVPKHPRRRSKKWNPVGVEKMRQDAQAIRDKEKADKEAAKAPARRRKEAG